MLVSPASPVEGACSDAPSAGVYRRTLLPRFRAQGSRRPQLVRESRTRAILTMEKPHDATPRAVARCTHRPGRVARRRRRRTLEDRPAAPPPPSKALLLRELLGHSILLKPNSPPDELSARQPSLSASQTNSAEDEPSECSPVHAGICGRLRPSATSPSASSKPFCSSSSPSRVARCSAPGAAELPSCRAGKSHAYSCSRPRVRRLRHSLSAGCP
jgi:hypothetical protein